MEKVLINSIINYYKDNVLYSEENCNIINHLLKVIITEYVPQKRYIIKNFDNYISETKIREEFFYRGVVCFYFLFYYWFYY